MVSATTPHKILPGPAPHPLLGVNGNGIAFLNDPIKEMGWRFARYGRITGLVGGEYPGATHKNQFIFAYGPELNREVVTGHDRFHKLAISGLFLSKDPSRYTEREFMLSRFMSGLFHVNEDEHRQHRRLLMPAFHKKAVDRYYDDVVAVTQATLDQWTPGQCINLYEDIVMMSLGITVKTLLGVELNDELARMGKALDEAMHMVLSPWAIGLPFDIPGLPYQRMLSHIAYMDNVMGKLIKQNQDFPPIADHVMAVLTQGTLEDGRQLSFDEIMGHATVIFGAGHETTASALVWTLFLLSQHPQVAADLVDELEGALQGSAPQLDQLDQLPLLDRVVNESMRVIPPVPLNSRTVAHHTELGGYPMHPGLQVIVSIYHTHHMPDVFPEPERFIPERWETIKPGPYTYNPFSAGPRMCIGAKFALMELKVILAMLLQRYRFEFAGGVSIDRYAGITMTPRKGMPMIVRRQDHAFERGVGGVRGNVREMVKLAP
ncbi:MAG: cytochrome P450 [Chloroflexi bacterium]|nr:cytochrome P450 [Chloroflexota bacterium]